MKNMTLQQLRYFKTLAELQYYAKVSEALMISQNDLISGITALEKELGVRLFNRRSKHALMTEEGEAFFGYVETALNSLENGKNEMQRFADEAKTGVSVGYIYSLSKDVQNILSGFAIDFEDDNIDMKYIVHHSNDDTLDELYTGRADFIFCTDPPENVESRKLFEQELFFAVSQEHPMAIGHKSVTKEMLENEPIVMIDEKTRIHYVAQNFFKEHGIIPKVACIEDTCGSAAAHVAAGYGYTIIPDLPELGQAGVRLLDSGEFSVKRPIYMAWRKDNELSRNASLLKKYILQMYGQI